MEGFDTITFHTQHFFAHDRSHPSKRFTWIAHIKYAELQRQIYQLLYGLATAGRTVILVSSDIAEIVGVCDRVIVMREGSLVADLARAEVSPERLIQLALPLYSGMQLSA